MVVQHTTGTLEVDGDRLVSKMSGTSGMFRKKTWQQEQTIPISRIHKILRVTENVGGSERVTLRIQRKDQGLPTAFTDCTDDEAVYDLLESVAPHVLIESDGVLWQAHQADLKASVAPTTAPAQGPLRALQCPNCGAPVSAVKGENCVHCGVALSG